MADQDVAPTPQTSPPKRSILEDSTADSDASEEIYDFEGLSFSGTRLKWLSA